MLLNVLDFQRPPGNAQPNAIAQSYTDAVTRALATADHGDRVYLPGVPNTQAPGTARYIYFYRLTAAGHSLTQRVIRIR